MKMRFKLHLTPQFLAWVIAIAATIGLLCYRLGTLLPGLSRGEQALPTVRSSLHLIWNQPLSLPIELSRLLVAVILPTGGQTASRLPSALLGLIVVALMYWLLRRWYGYRLALFGSVLTATAPWFLHVSRLATSDVVYPLAMTSLLIVAALWHQKQRSGRLLYGSAVTLALLLYVPGGIWLLGCLMLVEFRNIVSSLWANKRHTLLASLIFAVVLAPLVHALLENWHLYRALLGLPATFPSIIEFAKRFGEVWAHIFIGGYTNPVYNLGGLPVVNILTTLAFFTGIYLYAQHPKATRTRWLLLLWLVGTALVAFQGPVNLSLVMPIVMILATGGIGYLLHLWLRVFPRNPLARGFGIGLIGIVVLFAVTYNLRNYYVAWPLDPAARTAFQVRL